MRLDNAVNATNRTVEAGALTGVVGWAAQINWLGLTGAIVALAGFLANLYYQRKRDRREQAESDARLQALRDRCGL